MTIKFLPVIEEYTAPSLPSKGLCESCIDQDECYVTEALQKHHDNMLVYGPEYMETRPDLWDEEAIEDPDISNDGTLTWCPWYSKINS